MNGVFDDRPGVAYRRPDGSPDRLEIETETEPVTPLPTVDHDAYTDVVHPDDRHRLIDELDDDTADDPVAVDLSYRVTLPNQADPVYVHECGRWEDGDVVGYLLPTPHSGARRAELERQRERLEEFASVVSHDLRNPLSVAVGNLELARELDGEAADDRLERVAGALDRMDALISDLLALAREGHTVEETAEVPVAEVVRSALQTVDVADADIHTEENLGIVDCNRSRLQQVFENLARNAVEHAGEDVTLTVGQLPDGFYVADDGPGIPPDHREDVFEPGFSTDREGTGFGLAIVERIAEAHGWEVALADADGGARFDFTGVDPRGRQSESAVDETPDDGPTPRSAADGGE